MEAACVTAKNKRTSVKTLLWSSHYESDCKQTCLQTANFLLHLSKSFPECSICFFLTLLVIQVQCELQIFCNITTHWLAKYEQIYHATPYYQFFIKSACSTGLRANRIEDSINQVTGCFLLSQRWSRLQIFTSLFISSALSLKQHIPLRKRWGKNNDRLGKTGW